jgi:diguanylate cyclase (GGDEF)-like protein/PAS domain S-box-containing protein
MRELGPPVALSVDDVGARYQSVALRVFDMIAVIEPDTIIRWVSESITTHLGYDPAELVGTSAIDLVHPDDVDRMLDELAKELGGNNVARALTIRVLHADGEWRYLEVLASNQLADADVEGVILTLRDISSKRLADRAFAASEHLYRTLAMTATDITTITDLSNNRIYVSPSVTPMLGYQPEEFGNLPTSAFVHPDDLTLWHDAVAEAEAVPGGVRRVELRCRNAAGTFRWLEATAVNLHHDPLVGGLVVHARDVHERRQAQEALFHRALHDPLTGLPNRTALLDRLSSSLTVRSDTGGIGVAVLFCDLDGFKEINDRFGHHTGDEALNVVAQRIKAAVRPTDILARFGGDEFCVVCVDLADIDAAIQVAERVRIAIAEPLALYDAVTAVGVSIGIAWSGGEGLSAHDLLRRADDAMYRAKARGRDRVEVFTLTPPAAGQTSRRGPVVLGDNERTA